mgnify:FL=1
MKTKRTKKIMLRLTDSEYQKISENCQMPIARFIRETALGNSIVRRITPPKVDPKLIRQIAFIGNNLNQITKLAHQKNNNNELNNLALLSELALIRQSLDELKNEYTHKGQTNDS